MTGAIAAASAAEIENSFGQNPAFVESGSQVIVMKNGREAARLIPGSAAASGSSLTDSLTGILKEDVVDLKQAKEETLREKYEMAD